MDRQNKFEIFRFITPILVSLCLAVMSAVWRNTDDLSKAVETLKIDVAVLKSRVQYGR